MTTFVAVGEPAQQKNLYFTLLCVLDWSQRHPETGDLALETPEARTAADFLVKQVGVEHGKAVPTAFNYRQGDRPVKRHDHATAKKAGWINLNDAAGATQSLMTHLGPIATVQPGEGIVYGPDNGACFEDVDVPPQTPSIRLRFVVQ